MRSFKIRFKSTPIVVKCEVVEVDPDRGVLSTYTRGHELYHPPGETRMKGYESFLSTDDWVKIAQLCDKQL